MVVIRAQHLLVPQRDVAPLEAADRHLPQREHDALAERRRRRRVRRRAVREARVQVEEAGAHGHERRFLRRRVRPLVGGQREGVHGGAGGAGQGLLVVVDGEGGVGGQVFTGFAVGGFEDGGVPGGVDEEDGVPGIVAVLGAPEGDEVLGEGPRVGALDESAGEALRGGMFVPESAAMRVEAVGELVQLLALDVPVLGWVVEEAVGVGQVDGPGAGGLRDEDHGWDTEL